MLTRHSFLRRGLIYFLIAIYVIYAVTPWARGNEVVHEKVGVFLCINFLFNATWIVVFVFKLYWVSVVIIFGMLITLIIIYERVGVDYKQNMGRFVPVETVEGKTKRAILTTFQYWNFQAYLSLYMGWLSVASIANVALAIRDPAYEPLEGTTEAGWSAGMQTVAALLGLASLQLKRDVIYTGVIVWALFAIRDKQYADPVVRTSTTVLTSLLIVAGIAAIADLLRELWRRRVHRAEKQLEGPAEMAKSNGVSANVNANKKKNVGNV